MNMTHELIRRTLLLQLEAAYPVSLPPKTLHQGIQLAGITMDKNELLKELEYLLDKGFITLTQNELCPQHKRYKLSTKGIDFLENENERQFSF